MFLKELVKPNLIWLKGYSKVLLEDDIISGLIAAVVILPQAAALAALAGLPASYGIYTSVFPVIVAAVFGSSWHSISGPNTAISLMVSALLIKFNLSETDYIHMALFLALIVGVIQIAFATFKLGTLLDFVSTSVINSVSNAVGILIIVSAVSGLMGLISHPGADFLHKLSYINSEIDQFNQFAFYVGVGTIISGLIARHFIRRYYLVVAMLVGIIIERFLYGFIGTSTNIKLIGALNINLLPFSFPTFANLGSVQWIDLLQGGAGIAFVGILQSVVIARSLAEKSGQYVDINKEIFGQGMANSVAAFFSGFPGSASFNRSSVHYLSGAKTPLAAIGSGIFLFALVSMLGNYSSYLSVPTISGILILVGFGLLNVEDFKLFFSNQAEGLIFYIVLLVAVIVGISSAVVLGVILSVGVYLSRVSKPIITEIELDKIENQNIKLRGCLFFGSIKSVQAVFNNLALKDNRKGTLIVDLQEAVDFDLTAINGLQKEAEKRESCGGRLVLHLRESQIGDNSPFKDVILKSFARYGFVGSEHGKDPLVELQSKPKD